MRRAQPLKEATWEAIKGALQNPQLLMEEYSRRLAASGSGDDREFQRKEVALAMKRIKAQEDRITDAYVNEAMDLERSKQEMGRLKLRRDELERARQDANQRERQERSNAAVLEHLERFCQEVARGLENMAFEERQQLLRLVVEQVTVSDDVVTVETVIPSGDHSAHLRTPRGELVEP